MKMNPMRVARAKNSLKRAKHFTEKITTQTNDGTRLQLQKIAKGRIQRAQMLAAQRKVAKSKGPKQNLMLYTRTKQRIKNRVVARKNAALRAKK